MGINSFWDALPSVHPAASRLTQRAALVPDDLFASTHFIGAGQKNFSHNF
jgi:hypothetical protein